MKCKCKYCLDSKRIQTTKEIGENYNYSCKNHSQRAKLEWVLKTHIFTIIKDICIEVCPYHTNYVMDKLIRKLNKVCGGELIK